MKTKNNKTIGLVIPSIENPFYIRCAKQLEIDLRRRGYGLFITFMNGETYEESEAESLTNLSHMRVAGIVFSHRSKANEALVNNLTENGITLLQWPNYAYDNLNAVVMDDNYGMYIGTKHLMEHGHTSILYAGNKERLDGLYRAYREAGRDAGLATIYTYSRNETNATTIANISDLIRERKPTAIFAATDFMGAAAYTLKNLHLRIPEDVSFMLYDDQTWASMMDISVITIRSKVLRGT